MKSLKFILIFVLLLFSVDAFALSDGYKWRMRSEAKFLLTGKPIIYTWGSADARGLKADCSGYMYSIAKYAGLPIKRTTSARMALGLDGWVSVPLKLEDVDEIDLLFFTWPESAKTRPNGHVGMLLESHRSNLIEVTHASASKKQVIIQQYTPYLIKNTTAIRRLTFGDER